MRERVERIAVLSALLMFLSVSPDVRADSPPKETAESTEKGAAEADPETAEAARSAESTGVEFQAVQSIPVSPGQRQNPVDGSWFVEWRVRANDTTIKGNPERSFLNPDRNHHGEVTLLRKLPVWDYREMEIMGLYRYTDDPRVDPEVNSLQRGYVRFTGPSFELNFGDYLNNFSRFSFNQNTKGVSLWKQFESVKMLGTAGVFTDRWGSIFKGYEAFADPRQPLVPILDPDTGNPILDPVTGEPLLEPDPRNPNKPYTRFVAGYRVEKQFNESSFIAMNYVHGADIRRSLPEVAQLRPISNDILSFDTNVHVGDSFDIGGELAIGQSLFDSRIQRRRAANYAGRVEMGQRLRRMSWRFDYARFMPNFFSANARQVQDLQDLSARASFDLGLHTVLDLTYRHTNDNLPGLPVLARNSETDLLEALTNPSRTPDLNGNGIIDPEEILNHIADTNLENLTTTVQTPEARLSIRNLPPRGTMNLDFGFRERRFMTSNRGSFQTDPSSGIQTPLFRERVTRMPFIELQWVNTSSIFGLSYEYRQNRDRVQSVNTTLTNRFMGSYRGSYFLGNWVVSPMFRFETEPEAKSIECTDQDRQDIPSNLSRCFIVSAVDFPARDQTRSYQGSLNVDFPKYLMLELLYRELNAKLLTSFTKQVQDVNGADVTARFFGNGGYRRPYGRAALIYKFANSEDVQLITSYERAVNSFFNPNPNPDPDPDTGLLDPRSFRETVFQLEFVWRWNR